MILKDLIKEIPFEEVKKRLNVLYPNSEGNIKGYENVYKLLLKKKARKSTTIIDIEWVKDEDSDGGGYWDVHGRELNDDTKWGLDFSSFSYWLGFTIEPKDLSRTDKADFLAHVLWEMTFHGFSDKEIRKTVYEIKRAAKGPFKELKLEDL